MDSFDTLMLDGETIGPSVKISEVSDLRLPADLRSRRAQPRHDDV